MPQSLACEVARVPEGRLNGGTPVAPVVERAGLVRTARLIFDVTVYAHDGIAAPALLSG